MASQNEVARPSETRRRTVPEMEDLIGHDFKVLDRGFVRVVDYMGDDAAIVEAARVSYGLGTRWTNDDEGLLRSLMRRGHTSPFEMCELKLHVAMPIFVARQWVRHRTASMNEYSARYSELPDVFYVPAPWDVQPQSTSDKQGREGELPEEVREAFSERSRLLGGQAFAFYAEDLERGVSRELARMNLPLTTYTYFYWKIDLHNLLHFVALRADPHAQKEIRMYAETILDAILPRWVPVTTRAFLDYVVEGERMSRMEMDVLHIALSTPNARTNARELVQQHGGMSPREKRELLAKLRLET